jgi:hypothetical protein
MLTNKARLRHRAILDQSWAEFVQIAFDKPHLPLKLDTILTTPREVWTKVSKVDLDAISAFSRLALQECMIRVAERREFEEESKG